MRPSTASAPASQIHQVQLALGEVVLARLVHLVALDNDGEDGVRPTALSVHQCRAHCPVLVPVPHHIVNGIDTADATGGGGRVSICNPEARGVHCVVLRCVGMPTCPRQCPSAPSRTRLAPGLPSGPPSPSGQRLASRGSPRCKSPRTRRLGKRHCVSARAQNRGWKWCARMRNSFFCSTEMWLKMWTKALGMMPRCAPARRPGVSGAHDGQGAGNDKALYHAPFPAARRGPSS